jgi:hypothetical protein
VGSVMPNPGGQASRTDRRIRLPEGCRLGYYERGPSDRQLPLYFHGTPSSRAGSWPVRQRGSDR